MRLPLLLGVADALLEDLSSFLDKLPVQVDGISSGAPGGVVFSKDVLARTPIVLVHQRRVFLALVTQLLGRLAIAALVRLLRLFFFSSGLRVSYTTCTY